MSAVAGHEFASLELRPVDPARDYSAAVALISATNLHDQGQDENQMGALQLYENFGFLPHRRWATLRKAF